LSFFTLNYLSGGGILGSGMQNNAIEISSNGQMVYKKYNGNSLEEGQFAVNLTNQEIGLVRELLILNNFSKVEKDEDAKWAREPRPLQ
jgi:hypothetical protein